MIVVCEQGDCEMRSHPRSTPSWIHTQWLQSTGPLANGLTPTKIPTLQLLALANDGQLVQAGLLLLPQPILVLGILWAPVSYRVRTFLHLGKLAILPAKRDSWLLHKVCWKRIIASSNTLQVPLRPQNLWRPGGATDRMLLRPVPR